jgi:hypothetical protein
MRDSSSPAAPRNDGCKGVREMKIRMWQQGENVKNRTLERHKGAAPVFRSSTFLAIRLENVLVLKVWRPCPTLSDCRWRGKLPRVARLPAAR